MTTENELAMKWRPEESFLPKYIGRRIGDVSYQTDNRHVRVGSEDLLLPTHYVGGGLVDGESDEEAGGRVVRGLTEIVSTVGLSRQLDLETPVLVRDSYNIINKSIFS